MQALSIVWPLYCAFSAPGINEQQRRWISKKLWDIGKRAFIPKAMSLVSPCLDASGSIYYCDSFLLLEIG
jgi:hypothetical protein